MKFSFLRFFALLVFSLTVGQVFSQKPEVRVSGKVIERGGEPIMFATVVLKNISNGESIDGTSTLEDGTFSIVSKVDSFSVYISFLGFTPQTISDFTVLQGKVDLGTITLEQGALNLDEVEIEGERSTTEFKLDKKVFNVGSDLSSTGASALEVLNNVPSVNVDIEGVVSLRGSSGVQILINGKPSVLSEDGGSLGTITADMIERVEVITNPSAKYDAEGTSGIINIVLKKEDKKGTNGSISLNTGIPHNHSIGVSLNRRTEKFNLFSQLGYGYRELPRENKSINQNLLANSSVESEGEEFRNEQFYNITLGTDYHINNLNVLTLSGNFAYEIEEQPSLTSFRSIEEGILISEWFREEETDATNPKWQYELNYQKDFNDSTDQSLTFSALGRFFGKSLTSDFNDVTTFGESVDAQQRTKTDFSEANYTLKLDYTMPIKSFFTIETGGQFVSQDVSNEFVVSNFNDTEYIEDPNFTNQFSFDQKVLAFYGTAAFEKDKWGIKTGLRVENTDLKTLLRETSESNNRNYLNYFPSAHASYKFSEIFSVQAGYSKRIYRPRLWDLNPFFNIRNNFNIRQGNPDLNPEFTDSYEINNIFIQEKYSLNFAVYHRYTTQVIERISTFNDNVNVVKPLNIGSNRSTGLELNFKYRMAKKITFTGDLNYNTFNRKGAFEDTSFDFQGDQYSGKITSKLKLPKKFDVEITGNYQSRLKTVQSTVSDNLSMDLGIRKKLFKGKIVTNLSVRDVFASRFRESIISSNEIYSYNYGIRGRFITFGVSYGFGKGEAMQYSGGRRR